MSNNNKHTDTSAPVCRDRGGSYAGSTYAGALSFLRRQYSRDLAGVDVAVLGVPFDLATSYRPGARFGPAAVRAASVQLARLRAFPYGFDICEHLNIIDYGDVDFDYAHASQLIPETMKIVSEILSQGVKSLALGGDHFITYPILKAHVEKRKQPVALLHFDAHPDTWPDDGSRLDHGSMFTRAKNEGLVIPEKSVQVGIRTWVSNKQGFNHISAPQVHASDMPSISQQIREIIGDSAVYLTFDIDCLDPAFAPGTGTPVAGGLSSAQAMSIMRGLAGLNFIGMDIVEVAPSYDTAQITAIAAAHLAYQWLCLLALQKGAKSQDFYASEINKHH